MADQEQKPSSSDEPKNEFQPPPFALKEPPALKPMAASAQSAPPPFSFRAPMTPQVISSGSPSPSSNLPGFPQSSVQTLQPLQPLQPQSQPFLQMQPLQPVSMQQQQQQQPMQFVQQQHAQQGFPPQNQGMGMASSYMNMNSQQVPQQPQQPQQPMFPQQVAQPQPSSHPTPNDDQSQQILTKLQQFMNQMNSFMKSVDARLTTLEKMVQQVAVVQNQQLELAKASQQAVVHPPPQPSPLPVSHPSAPSHHPPPDFSRAVSDFPEPHHYSHPTPPPYLPDPYSVDVRPTTNYYTKSRQEMEDEELARRLQQEMNFEAQKSDTKRQAMMPNNSVGTDECPICKLTLPVRELEVHVQTHFPETYEALRRPQVHEKPQEEKSFWDRIFGSDDEKPAPPPPQPTPQPNLYPSFFASPPQGYSYINPN